MSFLSVNNNDKLYEAKLNAGSNYLNNNKISELNNVYSDNSVFASNPLQYNLNIDNNNIFNDSCLSDDEIEDTYISQNINTEDNSAQALYDELEQTKEEQGIIGKIWDGLKNITGLGAGSNKAQSAIEQYENGEISYEEALQKVENYKEGQETCVDVVGDMVSGIVAVGAFALAVPTGGASLVAGLGMAAAAGAGTKIAVKATDAVMGGREYTGKDLLYDATTGSINGLFAPVTNGVGACVTKTVGKKLGLTVVKEGTEEVIEQTAKQGIKSVITQQGVDVIGGTFAKRAAATAAGMAVDGAIGGSTDNMVRAALGGEDLAGILQAGVEGAAGGLIMSPVIGGGFKVAGKAGRTLNNKITTKTLFKEGMNTTFKQGQTGDCALLSFLNGAMNNSDTQDTIKKSITKSIGGDYHIRIGNQTIDIPKSALTDEMLSDTSGIKIFEAAYKKAGGSIDGEFADNVAKHFGFSPVHITSDSVTDETLDKIAKENGAILSLGAKVDSDGNIAKEGANHYFSIQSVDPDTKTVKVINPYDTSKTIELSYEDVKKFALSIDGGTKGETNLPNALRSASSHNFYGKNVEYYDGDTDILGYDGNIDGAAQRADMREHIFSGTVLGDDSLQVKKMDDELGGVASQLDKKSKYYELGAPRLNKKTNQYVYICENLRDMPDMNGVRGKNPLFGKNTGGLRFRLNKIKESGIDTIIDLRAQGECSKKAKDVLEDLGMSYACFPVEDSGWTKETLANVGNYIAAINRGNFYVGCANGQARTDLATCINYILNPKAKQLPVLYYGTPSSSRVSVKSTIASILDIIKENKQMPECWGWKSYDDFIQTAEKRFETLMRSLRNK